MNAKVTTTDITDGAVREFAPGKLTLVSQADGCTRRLSELCPTDQERTFKARWTAGHVLEFEEFTPEPPAALEVTGTGTDNDDPTAAEAMAAAAAAKAKARVARVAQFTKKLNSVSNANLQEMAARLGVAWVEADSRATRFAKIAEATIAAEEAAAEVESGT